LRAALTGGDHHCPPRQAADSESSSCFFTIRPRPVQVGLLRDAPGVMQGSEVGEVAPVSEGRLRESAVAELSVRKTETGPQWLITSWDRQVDQAITHALPSGRNVETSASCELVRVLLVDGVAIRIGGVGAVHLGTELGTADEQCPCRENSGTGTGGKRGCLCGCHFGAMCRQSILRNGRGRAPQAAFVFTLQAAPNLGPVFMRSISWKLSLWLRDIRDSAARSGTLTARLRLCHSSTRTRSGVEVTVAQAAGRRYESFAALTESDRSAEERTSHFLHSKRDNRLCSTSEEVLREIVR
jgi:hypothetical protein